MTFQQSTGQSATRSAISVEEVSRRARSALTPPPKLRLSEWAEANIRLPDGVSALPGPLRLWPYQREIADAISDPLIERVTLVKPVRVGFTTLLTSALASFVVNEPSPILSLLPTEADCRDYVVSDVEPIFEASPSLNGMLSSESEEAQRNTLMSRRFPGGSLKVVAAKAPRNLRRHNVRVLFVDEADAMEPGQEGSPLLLAERRTLSFADRKIVVGSTPLHEETSNVLRAYASSDQRIYEVPCPSCGGFEEIRWQHIEWEDKKPETAAYRCPHCKELIEERFKAEMVASGHWRQLRPDVSGHAGFRLNALISGLANASWAKLAAEFVVAKEDTDTLQVFVNTILGEGWKEQGEEIDENALASRAEDFSLENIPESVLVVTIGVDVQDDRLECSLVGWSKVGECIVLGHSVIWGSPDDDTTWAELDELLRTKWEHPFGGKLKVDAACVDSGDGDWTDRVYQFCFPRLSKRVMAIKGVSGTRPAIQASKSKVKGGRLFLVGVDGIKNTLMNRLARGSSIRLSKSLEPSYFEQLASERKVVRYSRGQPTRRFERKPGARAEALDCLVYAFAARAGVNISLSQREEDLRSTELQKRSELVRRSMRSSFMG